MYLVDQFVRRFGIMMAICLVVSAGCGGLNNQTDAIVDATDVAVSQDTISQDMAAVDAREVSEDVIADTRDVSTDEMVSDIDAVPDTEDVDTCESCTGGKVCQDGQCKCPVSQEDCSGTCKPLGTNSDCSICGDVCPTGGSCDGGTCECPFGQTDCHGACTELGTDDNCSRCDDACVGVKTCEDGECTAQTDPNCVSTIMCVDDEDCGMGSRCNKAISPPTCQKLYCGSYGSVCYEDYFCLSQICYDDACMNDCSGLECGPDPVYGESCGTCQEGATCKSNHCVCEPQDHLECVAGNATWINSCGGIGTVVEGCPLACLNGACVDCVAVGKVNCSGTCTLVGTNSNCSGCGNVCPVGGSCESGTCECPVGQADCSGTCKLMGTVSNCSGCGDVCTGGKECNDRTCKCPIGEAVCSGTCTLMGTITNCSGCGDVCTGGKECNDGTCECPVGEADCSGTCTLLGTTTNCSVCGDECPIGGSCESGTCNCPVGQADCSGTCKLLGTTTNCSGCGDICTGGKFCQDGTCNCPVGQADCSGTCKLLGTTTNCSGCGDICTGGKFCQDGTCECPVGEADCSGTCKLLGTTTNCSVCGDVCSNGEHCEDGVCNDGLILIPAGSFWMGCNVAVDDQCYYEDEFPYHEVTLAAFYMDKTEVTVVAYGECVTAGACTEPSTGNYCNWNVAGKEDHPVNYVTWYQSEAYCAWAGKRLPTEAEWEKAARGTDGRKYPWGNETATCDYAVMYEGGNGCGTDSTMSVCSKSPAGDSPYGLCDMSGNVWEWVSDWYSSSYYSSSPSSNPIGPASGSYRVIRSGGFYNDVGFGFLRALRRARIDPSGDGLQQGFRCAKDAL